MLECLYNHARTLILPRFSQEAFEKIQLLTCISVLFSLHKVPLGSFETDGVPRYAGYMYYPKFVVAWGFTMLKLFLLSSQCLTIVCRKNRSKGGCRILVRCTQGRQHYSCNPTTFILAFPPHIPRSIMTEKAGRSGSLDGERRTLTPTISTDTSF